ncbi:MAG: hypothetical protein HYU80_00120 [Candidatus Blackburnbacteria bacterium]|nr:hypothetical protein [Candidatus Blackburnbacteria bacterium]
MENKFVLPNGMHPNSIGHSNSTLMRVFPSFVEHGTKLEGVALKVFLDRYSLKDETGKPLEEYPEQMWRRVAKAVSQIEVPAKRREWEEKFYQAMEGLKFIPGGRILSGAGTGFAVTFYNCYVLPSPKDSRDGILDNLKEMVEIMSRGGGVGVNLSSLRPRGARVKKVNGFSSGPMNWAELYSVATHDIIQQGGSRRGALMIMMWDWHPDIEEFVTVKKNLSRLVGANLSVCVSDKFMEAVKNNGDWDLVFPDLDDPEYDQVWDGVMDHWLSAGKKVSIYKTIKARDLWDMICEAAWASAEPGLVFMERYNKLHSNSYFNTINCVNPCVTGDTLVITEDGWIQAEDLKVGMKILTPSGLRPIKKVYNNGKQQIFRVKFSDGGELKATVDHKLRVVRNKKYEWVEIGKLKKGDKVVVVDNGVFGKEKEMPSEAIEYADRCGIKVPKDYNRDIGFMMGVTIGDGYFGKIGQKLGYRMKIVMSRKELKWKKILLQEFSEFGVAPTESVTEYQAVYPDGTTSVHGAAMLNSYKFANVLGLAGLETRIGENKRIPPQLLNMSKDFQKGVIDGLFSTDGSVNLKTHDPSLRLTSSSYELLKQVRLLLLNFGIHAKIYSTRRKPTIYNGRDMRGTGVKYELLVMNEGISRFYKEIGLSHPEKARRLEQAAGYYFMSKTGLASVVSTEDTGTQEEVYDVLEPKTLTWITNGYLSLDCGEEGLPSYGVCNLGSLNLSAFVNGDGEMDYDALAAHARVATRFLDNIIDGDIYLFDGTRETQLNGERRVGLGTMGLGDALIKMKIKYGSEESLPVIEKIYQTVRDAAFDTSADLAAEKGPFPKFDAELYPGAPFIKMLPQAVQEKIKRQGVRNSVILMQAPTGSTSLMAGVTSGIEPVYEFSFTRRDRLGEHKIYHSLYKEWLDKKTGGEKLPSYFISANDLTPEEHIKVQAAVQKYVDASISKTVNAPTTHTVDDVKKLYALAYDLGLKGIAYMRDGSRPGVLSREETQKEEKKLKASLMQQEEPAVMPVALDDLSNHILIERPDRVAGATYRMVTPVGSAFITINNDITGDPIEVFVNIGKAGSDLTAMATAFGRMISTILRLNPSVSPKKRAEKIVDQLSGIGGRRSVGFGSNRIYSLPDAVAQALLAPADLDSTSDAAAGTGTFDVSPADLDSTSDAAAGTGTFDVSPADLDSTSDAAAGTGTFDVSPAETELSSAEQEILESDLNFERAADICPQCGVAAFVFEEGCNKCYSCGHSEC